MPSGKENLTYLTEERKRARERGGRRQRALKRRKGMDEQTALRQEVAEPPIDYSSMTDAPAQGTYYGREGQGYYTPHLGQFAGDEFQIYSPPPPTQDQDAEYWEAIEQVYNSPISDKEKWTKVMELDELFFGGAR